MKARLLVAALIVAGCASYGAGLRPGVATESDVRQAMGPPAVVLPNPDGSRQLAYPRGPLGLQTHMVRLAPDGRLERIENVLDEDHFYRIVPGKTRDDVLRLIGPPSETMSFPRTRQVAWDYRFQDTWGYIAIFSVIFDENGIVVGKFTKRIDRIDRSR